MSQTLSLGDRMKRYEAVSDATFVRRVPVILRVDGKAFHTLTRGMEEPWDDRLMRTMEGVSMALCEGIQGAKLGYVQSDEVSVLVTDFDTIRTDAWLGYRVQRMVSIAASIATRAFNAEGGLYEFPLATFDARAFNLPQHEVTNYFIWRQQDATRNSIQMLARAHFSHRQCHGLNTSELQDKLMEEKGVNWNDMHPSKKRGRCVVYREGGGWSVDLEPPVFTRGRDYVDSRMVMEL